MGFSIKDFIIRGFIVSGLCFALSANIYGEELSKLGEITGLPDQKANDAAIKGNYVYITYLDSGLHVYDISDPSSPVSVAQIDSINTQEEFGRIKIKGDYAYCAGRDIRVIDVSDPSSPSILDTVDLDESIERFSLSNDTLFAAADQKGFHMLDISNPSDVTLISSYYVHQDSSDYSYVSGIGASDGYAFVAYEDSGVQAVDLSSMQLVGSYYTEDLIIRDIDASESMVYLAAYEAGLLILDASDPSGPVLEGDYDLIGKQKIDIIK